MIEVQTVKANRKMSPFKVGDRVRHIKSDCDVRIVMWVSKASSRGSQVIATDYDPNNTVQAEIYVDAQ